MPISASGQGTSARARSNNGKVSVQDEGKEIRVLGKGGAYRRRQRCAIRSLSDQTVRVIGMG